MKPPRDAVAVEGRGTADGPAPEPRSRPDRDAPSHAGLVIAATVFLVAAELRLWRIQQSYELFIDEVTYTEIARNVALGQGVLLYGEPFFLHPPAMFSSLALAMTLTGPDEDIAVLAFALRPLPAVIGALTPGLVALLLHRLTRSVGLATAGGLLLAVEPFLIRFDSRVLLEAQAMAASAAGFVMLMVIVDRERCGRPVSWRAILAGLLLLASLLTKETYAFVSIIPVLGLLATGLALRRSTSATVVATIVAGYAAYVLALVFAGQGAEWFAQKTRGVRRLLGLSQITGFNQEGSVGLVERIVANLSYFTVTYALIGSGLLALGWLLLELRRGVPAPSRPGIILLVAWALGATVHLAYAVTLGTLEEQMFYLMVVTTAPALFVAAHMLLRPGEYGRCHRATRTGRTRASALRLVLLVALALAFVVDTAVWWRVHTIPDVAYTRFLAWARVELPPGSTLAVTDETTQFVLRQVRVGRWETGEQLRENDADYVLLVGELVRQGYSDVDEEFLQIASRGPVVFEAKGRSLGVVTVHDVRAVIAD